MAKVRKIRKKIIVDKMLSTDNRKIQVSKYKGKASKVRWGKLKMGLCTAKCELSQCPYPASERV